MIQLNVTTSAYFADEEALEEFLKAGAFEPYQVTELLDDRKLVIEEEDPNELAVRPTKNEFTWKEVE